jgi:hypothetical protein
MKTAFIIIVIHFIADFVCQDERWAMGKSKNWKDLLTHTFVYSWLWFIPVFFLFPNNWSALNCILNSLLFVFITFIAHTTTDYFTSRVTSRLYKQGKFGSSIPNLGFFTMIGFDQVLHYAQLFLTLYYLVKIQS